MVPESVVAVSVLYYYIPVVLVSGAVYGDILFVVPPPP